MRPSPQFRELAESVAKAHAGLTALACGFTHDGKQLKEPETVLAAALGHLARAYELRSRIGGGGGGGKESSTGPIPMQGPQASTPSPVSLKNPI
ncbi:MAG TPA: hypothetical protein PLX89_07685 [Verrucomicrobiota bacterium]|nr:hypothetical protein [Verrucomicrobiales bacterium]HRI12870.1 hypothetical protein [Verrucomicrobiota bacterium]